MLTPEQIQSLQESIANDNWDSGVSVEQDENGVLTFVFVDEDDEEEARVTATPCGSFEEHDLYRLRNSVDDESEGAITTLVAIQLFIVGLLGL